MRDVTDAEILSRAIHEAAHVVVGAVLIPPVVYSEVSLTPTDGNTAYSVTRKLRIRSAEWDCSLPEHQRMAREEILVSLAGPSPSKRIDPPRRRRKDEADYRNAKMHAERLSSATGIPATRYIAQGEEEADAFTENWWNAILAVGHQFFMQRQGQRGKVDQATMTDALRKAGLPSPE
jgi:hypothetical protein